METTEIVEELLTTSRAFVGLAVRSIATAPVEVTVAQHRLLVLLAAHGPQSVGAIAAQLGVNQSNASRHCDRLQRLGLLTRRRSSTDGRVVRVELTADGRRLLDAVTERRREALRQVLERMDAADAEGVAAAFRAFNLAAQEIDQDQWVDVGGWSAVG
jgi:DNA-binding MarR family transcriptional regulator